MSLVVGEIYRLRFPGFGWARVLPNPPDTTVTMDDGSPGYLIETLFTKNRWWARGDGKPNNHRSPWLVVPRSDGAGQRPLDRDAIARIINPSVFSPEYVHYYPDRSTVEQFEAYQKADAILALLSTDREGK